MLSKPRRLYFSASSPAARQRESVASRVRYVGHCPSNSRFADVNFDEVTDDVRASLGHVKLNEAACVQVQRHRRSSSTTDDAVLPVIFAGRLAPFGLPPFQCARPSATSWCAQSTSAGTSTGLIVAID